MGDGQGHVRAGKDQLAEAHGGCDAGQQVAVSRPVSRVQRSTRDPAETARASAAAFVRPYAVTQPPCAWFSPIARAGVRWS